MTAAELCRQRVAPLDDPPDSLSEIERAVAIQDREVMESYGVRWARMGNPSGVVLLDGSIGGATAAGGDWRRIVPCFHAAWTEAQDVSDFRWGDQDKKRQAAGRLASKYVTYADLRGGVFLEAHRWLEANP